MQAETLNIFETRIGTKQQNWEADKMTNTGATFQYTHHVKKAGTHQK